MNWKLKEQEEQISLLQSNHGKMFHNEEEWAKNLRRAMDEQNALMNQLNSTNSTITSLKQEMQSKEVLIEEMKIQIHNLETQLAKAIADRKDVQNLSSSDAERGSELRSLKSYHKDELSNSQLQIQELKDELQKIQEELQAKDSSIIDLNASVKSLTVVNYDIKRAYSIMEEKYMDLKLTADKKAASDAKLVREREEELHQLKEKLEHAINDGRRKQVIIAELTQDRELLKDSLENEFKEAYNLISELQITQENHEQTRKEAAQLGKYLDEASELHKDMEAEISKLSVELFEVSKSLQSRLDDEKHKVEMLNSLLSIAKENLQKSQVELQSMSHALKDTLKNHGMLQKELAHVHKKHNTAVKDLNVEKMLVASLKDDVQLLESDLFKAREVRKSLELNLKETTKSLDVMNQKAMFLSDQLKSFKSRIINLEDDKQVLQRLLADEKRTSKQTQEILEDAQNHITKLGLEKGNLESKANKLEEELASAKGEILHLKSQKISSSEAVKDDEGERLI